jgi:hypothetical protein
MAVVSKKRTRRSARGNWLVVEIVDGQIYWCTWVRTWAGAQASKRHKEKSVAHRQEFENRVAVHQKRNAKTIGRVFILDIERMLDFAVTEGANQINDLYKLWEKE